MIESCRRQIWKGRRLGNRRGATAVLVGILLFALAGFTALAIDLGHQFVVRNELQNAADAGALAGARKLYTPDGKVNTDANLEAQTVATANRSDQTPVEVNLSGGNGGDVQRGFWDFDARTFTQVNSLNAKDVNAVYVRTGRSASASFFASIFGYASFSRTAEAVAYRGFAGNGVDYDQPIALCEEKITDPATGKYDCTMGRMIHSGKSDSNQASAETGRWTNFSAECMDPANTGSIRNMVCGVTSGVNTGSVSTSNGEVQPAMDELHSCWVGATGKSSPWYMILPVIECPQGESPTCSKIVAAVGVEIVWVTENGEDPDYSDIPEEMSTTDPREDWPGDWYRDVACASFDLQTVEGRKSCWNDFMTHFGILDEASAPYEKIPVSLYFTPSCDTDIEGGVGGEDFNIRAENPKLVL